MRKLIVFATVLCLASVAGAGQTPGQKCQTGKNQEAGKYAACLTKAEARLLKTKGACSVTSASVCYGDNDCPIGESCSKDLAKYAAAVTKCEDKFETKWNKLEDTALDKGDVCPDGLLQGEVKEVLDECVGNVAGGLAGEGLDDCGGELVTCEDDLTTCEADLGSTETQLTTCETDLGTTGTQLVTCEDDLTVCEDDLVVAQECGDGGIDAGEDCDLGNLNGGTCVSEGFAGGVLRCGSGCVYDTGECYATRFVDNADGTITDNETGLMWEKKVKLNSAADLANLQDADNAYRWSGTCSVTTSKRCQPDAAAEAACLAGVGGSPDGCSQCSGGEGTCSVGSPGVTVWQWLVALNTANFAGYNDWRLATKDEYSSISDDTDATPPGVNVAFHGASCGGACTDLNDPACSCTRSDYYWSASTYVPAPQLAWGVSFNDDTTLAIIKPFSNQPSVRAVRGGS